MSNELLLRRRELLLQRQEGMNIRAVCFEADGDQTVSITKNDSAPTLTMQYSYDGVSWENWDLSTGLQFGGSTKVYVRGVGNTRFASNTFAYNSFTFGTDAFVYVSGIIETLLDWETDILSYSTTYVFYNLFYNQAALRSAKGLIFSASNMTSDAYSGMFQYCGSLLYGPESLPATTLAKDCYAGMFMYCTNLNYIRCHAKNSNTGATDNWLYRAASNGTLYGYSEYGWASDESGIPSGWTFVQSTEW